MDNQAYRDIITRLVRMLVTANSRIEVLNNQVETARNVFYYIYHINMRLWPRFRVVWQRNVRALARATAEVDQLRAQIATLRTQLDEVDQLRTQIATLRTQLDEANIELSHLRNMGRGNAADDAEGSKKRRM